MIPLIGGGVKKGFARIILGGYNTGLVVKSGK